MSPSDHRGNVHISLGGGRQQGPGLDQLMLEYIPMLLPVLIKNMVHADEDIDNLGGPAALEDDYNPEEVASGSGRGDDDGGTPKALMSTGFWSLRRSR